MRNKKALLILLQLILCLPPLNSFERLAGYNEDEWGKAFLIVVNNQTSKDVELIFPDDPGTKRSIPPGGKLGKEPGTGAQIAGKLFASTDGRDSIDANPLISNSSFARKPILKGLGFTQISGINGTMLLNLKEMRGEGGAWFNPNSTSFSVPCSLTFGIHVEEKGSAALIFASDEFKDTPDIKIVFGANENSSLDVIVNELKIAQIETKNYPQLAIKPGRVNKYWISMLEDSIIIGTGENVGAETIIQLPVSNLNQLVKRLGFLSYDHPINFTTIEISPPIKFIKLPGETKLNQIQNNFDLISTGIGSVISKSLNEKSGKDKIIFSSETGQSASVQVSKGEGIITIYTAGIDSEVIKTEQLEIKEDNTSNLIYSLKNNTLSILKANSNFDNLKLVTISSNPFWGECTKFTTTTDGKNQYYLSSPISSTLDPSRFNSKLNFSGNLRVLRPFEYQFKQEGPAIICTDNFSNKSFALGQAAQQGAYYSFMANIESTGAISSKWIGEPVNPGKIGLKLMVAAIGIVQSQLMMKADEYTGDEVQEIATQLKMTAQNIGYAIAGGIARAASGVPEAAIANAYRDAKATYVFQEEQKEKSIVSQTLPNQAKINIEKINSNLMLLQERKLNTREDYDFFLGIYSTIVGLINSSFVVAGYKVKKTLIKGLEKLVGFENKFTEKNFTKDSYNRKVVQETKSLKLNLLKLITEICNNPHLTTYKDEPFKQAMFTHLFNVSENYINNEAEVIKATSVFLPKSDDIIYQTGQIIKQGSGSVIFKARGTGNFEIILIDTELINAVKSDKLGEYQSIYQLTIGENNNKDLTLRTANGAPPVKTVSLTAEKNFSLNELEFKPFWIDVNKGIIRVGAGIMGTNECFSWSDSNEVKKDFLVSLRLPKSGVEIQGFASGPAANNFSEPLLNMIKCLEKPKDFPKNYITLTTKAPHQIGTLPTGDGTLVSKLELKKDVPLQILVKNDQFKLSYNFQFLVVEKKTEKKEEVTNESLDKNSNNKNLELELIFQVIDLNTNKVEQTKTENIKDLSTMFWMEINNGLIQVGFNNFWEKPALFSTMIHKLKKTELSLQATVNKGEMEIMPFSIMPLKKEIDYSFLYLLSNGAVKIPKSDMLLEEEERLEYKAAMEVALDNEIRNNPLLMDLGRMDRQLFADLLSYAAMDDDYDTLIFDDLSQKATNSTIGKDTLSTDPLLSDKLAEDNLRRQAAKEKALITSEESQESREQRGEMQRLATGGAAAQMQALVGEAAQAKQLKATLWNTPKHLIKKNLGLYQTNLEMEEGEDGTKGGVLDGLKGEFSRMKDSYGKLKESMKRVNHAIEKYAENKDLKNKLMRDEAKNKKEEETKEIKLSSKDRFTKMRADTKLAGSSLADKAAIKAIKFTQSLALRLKNAIKGKRKGGDGKEKAALSELKTKSLKDKIQDAWNNRQEKKQKEKEEYDKMSVVDQDEFKAKRRANRVAKVKKVAKTAGGAIGTVLGTSAPAALGLLSDNPTENSGSVIGADMPGSYSEAKDQAGLDNYNEYEDASDQLSISEAMKYAEDQEGYSESDY